MIEKNWKEVYRRVKSKPVFMNNEQLSSALFKDSKGVSVNYDAGRDINEIIEDEERLHKLYNSNLTDEEIIEKGGSFKGNCIPDG